MSLVEELPVTGPLKASAGWAYVPDFGPSSIAAVQPGTRHERKRAAALTTQTSTTDHLHAWTPSPWLAGNTAKAQKATQARLDNLSRENYRDNIQVPIPPRAGRDPKKQTANVRRILTYQRTFAHYLADEEGSNLNGTHYQYPPSGVMGPPALHTHTGTSTPTTSKKRGHPVHKSISESSRPATPTSTNSPNNRTKGRPSSATSRGRSISVAQQEPERKKTTEEIFQELEREAQEEERKAKERGKAERAAKAEAKLKRQQALAEPVKQEAGPAQNNEAGNHQDTIMVDAPNEQTVEPKSATVSEQPDRISPRSQPQSQPPQPPQPQTLPPLQNALARPQLTTQSQQILAVPPPPSISSPHHPFTQPLTAPQNTPALPLSATQPQAQPHPPNQPQNQPSRQENEAENSDLAALLSSSDEISPAIPTDRVMQLLTSEAPLTWSAARATPLPTHQQLPLRRFCGICGYWGKIQCVRCAEGLCGLSDCYARHQPLCAIPQY